MLFNIDMVKENKTAHQIALEKEIKLIKSLIIKIQGPLPNLLNEELSSQDNYRNLTKDYKKKIQSDKRRQKRNFKLNIKSLKTHLLQLQKDFIEVGTLPDWFDDINSIIKACYSEYYVEEEGYGGFSDSHFDFAEVTEPLDDVFKDIKELEKEVKNDQIKISNPKPEISFHKSGIGYIDGQKFTLQKNDAPYIVFKKIYENINTPVKRADIMEITGIVDDGTDSGRRTNTYIINNIIKQMRKNTGLTTKNIVLNKDLTLIGEKID